MLDTVGLSESARRTLEHMARQLRAGFSGRFEVECNKGGVRRLDERRSLSAMDLATELDTSDAA